MNMMFKDGMEPVRHDLIPKLEAVYDDFAGKRATIAVGAVTQLTEALRGYRQPSRPSKTQSQEKNLSPKEVETRQDQALLRALKTPPKELSKFKGKSLKGHPIKPK